MKAFLFWGGLAGLTLGIGALIAATYMGLSPIIAADLVGIVVLASYWMFLVAPTLDTHLSWRQRIDKIAIYWLWVSSITHTTWELAWCFAHPYLHDVGPYDQWSWIFWAYGVADHRYLLSDTFVVPMEWVTSVVGGPMAFISIYWLRKGKLLWGQAMVCALSIMEAYGTVLYWGTEWANGWQLVDRSNWISWYVKFWGLNGLWVIFPTLTVYASYRWISEKVGSAADGAPNPLMFAK